MTTAGLIRLTFISRDFSRVNRGVFQKRHIAKEAYSKSLTCHMTHGYMRHGICDMNDYCVADMSKLADLCETSQKLYTYWKRDPFDPSYLSFDGSYVSYEFLV